MKLRKSIKFIFFILSFLIFFQKPAFAAANSFVTVVNPVRGEELQDNKSGTVLENVKFQKNILDKTGLSATWLLRSDAIDSASFSGYFKTFSGSYELGIFLEVMPKLAEEASVDYPQGGVFWHDANKIFLSGYKPEERRKLIDAAFLKFKNTFGYFPKSVGAWHIDAYSVRYMRQKYGVTGVLICSDQFSTDGYQIWGGWWGVPYYPSKFNILVPAQTTKNKIKAVVFWWAARDPELAYRGTSVFSVQPNDYLGNGKNTDYFNKLLDIYLLNSKNSFNQLTIGLENDYDMGEYGREYKAQLEEIARRNKIGQLEVKTMSGFAGWYLGKFKGISPNHSIASWQMSSQYRINLIEKDGKKYIEDLRIYNENWPESNLLTANPWGTLSLNNPYKIDTVRFPQAAKEIFSDISVQKIINSFGKQNIPFNIKIFPLIIFYLIVIFILFFILKNNLSLFFLTVLGTTSLSLTMIKSGLIYPFGMGFWGPNGHDGIWHIVLINQLGKFSLNHPLFSGARLENYHFGFDFLSAILHLLTGISAVNLYFQILPPIMAVLLGVLTYQFVKILTSSSKSAWWATFFVYFGGSWGWLVGLIKNGKLGGESMFWANQSISALINPPFVLSLIVLLTALIYFKRFLDKPGNKNLIIGSLLFGILLQIKVYAGIISLLSLVGVLLLAIIYKKDRLKISKIFFASLAISLVTFLPFNYKSSSLLIFSPLWFPRTMLAFGDRLGWFKLESARITYFYSKQWLKWILAEGLALTIFIFGNIGTRLIGFLRIVKIKEAGEYLKNFESKSLLEIFLFIASVVSLLIPLLFIQKGNPWNTIQFFYYFQFFLAIFSGIVIGKWWEKTLNVRRQSLFRLFISLVIVFLTLPTSLISLRESYLPSRAPSRISFEELEALDFLKKQPQGVILSYPFIQSWFNKFSEPRPLYAYVTTGYISALSGKQSFLADEMNLEISQYDWQVRKDESLRFFVTNDSSYANTLLKKNNIKYIYLVKEQKLNLGLDDINAQLIFENGEVKIYGIN